MPGGADRAEVELALAADVEQAHPERDRGASPVNASGVAEMSVVVSAPSARNAGVEQLRNVGQGA